MTDRELFIAALDRADLADRDAWLAEVCADDAERRRRVDVLLRAHDQASQFLAEPAMAQLEAGGPTQTAGETSIATDADIRACLTPSDKAGHLGKLDHYEVVQVVGRGGMGVVLKAFDPKLHRLVAIKLMATHLASSAAARQRFEREARAVAAVRNEHVVAIHAVEPAGPTPYLVMEFVGGVSLQDRLEQRGSLEVKEILRIGMQAARGLAAAHLQGIVHRDIKPANILLENGVERVKITDFGLARTADDANLTQSGVITGTPNYMSPEQAASATIDSRSDLFSLGAVLYSLCTGHPPFRAETPLAVLRRVCDDPPRPVRETNPENPDWLAAIVHKLLAKKPDDRFQNATEVAELLGQHLAHLQQPSTVPMPAAVKLPGSNLGQSTSVAATRAGCLAALIFVIGLVLLVAFRDNIWGGFFRPGYWAPVYMLLVSGVLLLIQWLCRAGLAPGWDRRLNDLSMIVVIGGTVAALTVGWEDHQHGGKLSRALDWHTGALILAAFISGLRMVGLVRWIAKNAGLQPSAPQLPSPSPPIPPSSAQTSFALGAGYFVLVAGFIASLMIRDLVTPVESRNLALSFVLGLWSTTGILAFGPGVFIARRWWRKCQPEERRADTRAAILAGLGLGATILSVVLTVIRTPGLGRELFGDPQPTNSSLALNWNRDLIARVTLERDGRVVDQFVGPTVGAAEHLFPGPFTVRGFKNDREVYRQDFDLPADRGLAINLFDRPQDPETPRLLVECQDPSLTIEATSPGHQFRLEPGTSKSVWQGLNPGATYRIGIARGNQVIHVEDVRLDVREERAFRIPPVVRTEKAVELKPKTGSFPSDLVRMRISPDRSLVAAERFAGPVVVFDAESGKERFTIARPQSHCTAFGFTPDSRRLAYLTQADGTEHVMRQVDARDGSAYGKELKPKSGRNFSNSHSLAFSPDGTRLAIGSANNADPDNRFVSRVLRWDLTLDSAGPRELAPLEWQEGTIKSLCFTPNGSEVLGVAGTHTWTAWAWDTGQPNRRNESEVNFTYDRVAVGGPVEAVAGWGELMKQPSVMFGQQWPQGRVFMAGVDAGPIRFGSLAVSVDGKLAAAGVQGTAAGRWEERPVVRMWDTGTQKPRAVLLGHTDWPLDLAFAPNGGDIVSASKDGTLRVWKLP